MNNLSSENTSSSSEWSLDSLKNKAKQGFSSFKNFFDSKTTEEQPTNTYLPTGGRRTKRHRKQRKGGDTIATNAEPVRGLQVAKPTYWIKGGKSRRTRRRKNKTIRKRKSASRRHRK